MPDSTIAQYRVVKATEDKSNFPRKPKNITAIMGAFPAEVELIEAQLTERQEVIEEGLRFVTGKFGSRNVVVSKSGIGKVNAALTVATLLAKFRPREVIFSGIAGGINPDLNPGDIIIGTQIGYHDYGYLTDAPMKQLPTLNPYTFSENPVLFPADSSLLLIAGLVATKLKLESIGEEAIKIKAGKILTGDVFMASDKQSKFLREKYQADAVEMEGAAIAQVCFQQKVPFLIIRSLSDRADASATTDIARFVKLAANNSAAFVRGIVQKLR